MKTLGKEELYSDYIDDILTEIKGLRNSLNDQSKLKDHYLETIISYSEYYKYSKNSKPIPKDQFIENIKHSIISTVSDSYTYDSISKPTDTEHLNIFKSFINNFVYRNNRVKYLNGKIEELKTYLISKEDYIKINDSYNQELVKFLLDGNTYSLGSRLGNIYIAGKARSKKSIDWGESNKYKQQLLDSGQIPYRKEDSEKAKARGEDYKGVMWYIYNYSKYVYHLKWTKPLFVKNIKLFSFIPSIANNTKMSIEKLKNCSNFKDIPNLNIGMVQKIKLSTEYDNDHYRKYLNKKVKDNEL